jgi:hypothetical protein
MAGLEMTRRRRFIPSPRTHMLRSMARIVTTTYRYKPPPKKKRPIALQAPVIVTKKNRRPAERAAAEVVSRSPRLDHGAAHPSTPRDAERDSAVTTSPSTNDVRKSAIVTTTGRKRLKLLRAEAPPAADPEKAAQLRLERAKWGRAR